MNHFSPSREIRPYMRQPEAMPVGTPGKSGYLKLVFGLDDEGRSSLRYLDRRAPLIVQQALYFDEQMPDMPCVYILSSGGPNVDGDRYEQHFTVEKDACAFVSTGAATKLAEMEYNYSGQRQSFVIDENGYIEYLPEPVIPCRHTRLLSDTEMVVDSSATLFHSEIFLGGRKYYGNGELFDYDMISVCAHARRPDGQRLFREKFVIRPKDNPPDKLGVMGDYDIFANVIVLTPEYHARQLYHDTAAFIDTEQRLAAGITRLPNDCGLLYKVLGCDTGTVKRTVRRFCSAVRMQVKGRPLPDEFPWR